MEEAISSGEGCANAQGCEQVDINEMNGKYLLEALQYNLISNTR